jgi:hypothetical protein
MHSLWEWGRASALGATLDSRFRLFPYREEETVRGRSRRLPRPTVDATLASGEFEATTKCLIDTGSPRCVFPRGAAVALDLELPESAEGHPDVHDLRFLGENWEALPFTVQLTLPPYEDLTWEAEADFVLNEGLPFGLLGHEGFLDRWAVSFNAYHDYSVLEPVEALHQRVPVDVFRVWQEEWPDYN